MNDQINSNIIEAAFPEWTLEIHEQLPSTNQYMMQNAATIKTPAVVVAEQQTEGRGRDGNSWWSDRTSLTFSVMISPGKYGFDRSQQQLFSLITAALVRESIMTSGDIDGSRVQLKWPNDIYLDGKKVCGILLEQPGTPNDVIVIGIGLNVNNSFFYASDEIREKAISIRDASTEDIRLTTVLFSIIANFEDIFEDEERREDYFPFAWEEHHLLDQKMVTIDQSGKKITGRCEGIDESGAMLLRDMHGLHQIHSAVIVSWE
jgi:BirA family biotin operon repressor/biotin-[acetyl-CoA-carboxylase] ligase